MKGLDGFDAEHAERGEDAAEDGCSHGEDEGEGENEGVDGDGCCARNREVRVGSEAVDGDDGESDAEGSTDEREDADFGEGRLQKVCGGGAECRAYGGFAVASDEAGELRVGEVDAGNEQDAEDGGHEKPEAGGGFSDEHLLHGLDVGGDGAFGVAVELVGGNLAGDVGVNGVDFSLCLGGCDAGFESAEGYVVSRRSRC